MSITHNQRCRGVQRKLSEYLQIMVENADKPGVEADHAFDGAAWAFTGTLTNSAEAACVVGAVAEAFDEGENIEDWNPDDDDTDDPRVGLAVLYDMLQAYNLLLARGEDQCAGTTTGDDCATDVQLVGCHCNECKAQFVYVVPPRCEGTGRRDDA